ncbi:MAG: cytochrome c1 [Zoogloeaceae bacterium]|nr:cytochrome c1 [Zoogloeaceae bacterium]
MIKLKTFLAALLFAPALALAAGGVELERAPDISGDNARLQNGARTFVHYCLACHSASALRFNRLTQIGFTEEQIKSDLLYTTDKIGNPMLTALRPADGKKWFGAMPPDLSLVTRARASEAGSGADWVYTYLLTFFRDPNRPTGWNNTVFDSVGMPHVLAHLQGEQVKGADGHLLLAKPGQESKEAYETTVADLVGFLKWAGEPDAGFRKQLGIWVLVFLAIFGVLAYKLKKEFWKDVH